MKDADGTTAVNGYAEEADVDGCARSPLAGAAGLRWRAHHELDDPDPRQRDRGARRAHEFAPARSGHGWHAQFLAARGLKVSQPGDAGERQAERIAEAVMSPGGCTGCTPVSPCASCASGIQRAADGAAPESASLPGLGSGRPLDASSRDFFEPRFGRDLGAVRVHDGPREGNDGAIAGGARLYPR